MDAPFSLYIDHQKIAPLVRLLESAVDACGDEQEEECKSFLTQMSRTKSG